jgi:3-hydroxyacyl-CoA dehydrogenase
MTRRASALGLWEGLADLAPVAETQPDLTEVQHRLMIAQVLEAVRALEEGVLTDIREGDVGAILGWGFAPWSGGPFSWLDMLGAAYAAERCDALEAAHGDRFACPALLREMAEKGQTFYGRFTLFAGWRAGTGPRDALPATAGGYCRPATIPGSGDGTRQAIRPRNRHPAIARTTARRACNGLRAVARHPRRCSSLRAS